MKYEVLYYLMNEKVTLVEIKRSDLPSNSPKEHIYQWLVMKGGEAIRQLEFSSMKEEEVAGKLINIRVFKGAELRFDELFGKFVLGDELFILKNCSSEKVPQNVTTKISSLNNSENT